MKHLQRNETPQKKNLWLSVGLSVVLSASLVVSTFAPLGNATENEKLSVNTPTANGETTDLNSFEETNNNETTNVESSATNSETLINEKPENTATEETAEKPAENTTENNEKIETESAETTNYSPFRRVGRHATSRNANANRPVSPPGTCYNYIDRFSLKTIQSGSRPHHSVVEYSSRDKGVVEIRIKPGEELAENPTLQFLWADFTKTGTASTSDQHLYFPSVIERPLAVLYGSSASFRNNSGCYTDNNGADYGCEGKYPSIDAIAREYDAMLPARNKQNREELSSPTSPRDHNISGLNAKHVLLPPAKSGQQCLDENMRSGSCDGAKVIAQYGSDASKHHTKQAKFEQAYENNNSAFNYAFADYERRYGRQAVVRSLQENTISVSDARLAGSSTGIGAFANTRLKYFYYEAKLSPRRESDSIDYDPEEKRIPFLIRSGSGRSFTTNDLEAFVAYYNEKLRRPARVHVHLDKAAGEIPGLDLKFTFKDNKRRNHVETYAANAVPYTNATNETYKSCFKASDSQNWNTINLNDIPVNSDYFKTYYPRLNKEDINGSNDNAYFRPRSRNYQNGTLLKRTPATQRPKGQFTPEFAIYREPNDNAELADQTPHREPQDNEGLLPYQTGYMKARDGRWVKIRYNISEKYFGAANYAPDDFIIRIRPYKLDNADSNLPHNPHSGNTDRPSKNISWLNVHNRSADGNYYTDVVADRYRVKCVRPVPQQWSGQQRDAGWIRKYDLRYGLPSSAGAIQLASDEEIDAKSIVFEEYVGSRHDDAFSPVRMSLSCVGQRKQGSSWKDEPLKQIFMLDTETTSLQRGENEYWLKDDITFKVTQTGTNAQANYHALDSGQTCNGAASSVEYNGADGLFIKNAGICRGNKNEISFYYALGELGSYVPGNPLGRWQIKPMAEIENLTTSHGPANLVVANLPENNRRLNDNQKPALIEVSANIRPGQRQAIMLGVSTDISRSNIDEIRQMIHINTLRMGSGSVAHSGNNSHANTRWNDANNYNNNHLYYGARLGDHPHSHLGNNPDYNIGRAGNENNDAFGGTNGKENDTYNGRTRARAKVANGRIQIVNGNDKKEAYPVVTGAKYLNGNNLSTYNHTLQIKVQCGLPYKNNGANNPEPTRVRAWADFNRNNQIDAGESSNIADCQKSNGEKFTTTWQPVNGNDPHLKHIYKTETGEATLTFGNNSKQIPANLGNQLIYLSVTAVAKEDEHVLSNDATHGAFRNAGNNTSAFRRATNSSFRSVGANDVVSANSGETEDYVIKVSPADILAKDAILSGSGTQTVNVYAPEGTDRTTADGRSANRIVLLPTGNNTPRNNGSELTIPGEGTYRVVNANDGTISFTPVAGGRARTPVNYAFEVAAGNGMAPVASAATIIPRSEPKLITEDVAYATTALPAVKATTNVIKTDAGQLTETNILHKPGTAEYNNLYGNITVREDAEADDNKKVPERYRVDVEYGIGKELITEFRGKFTIENENNITPGDLNFTVTRDADGNPATNNAETLNNGLFQCKVLKGAMPATQTAWEGVGINGYYLDNQRLPEGSHYFRCLHKNIANVANAWEHSGHLAAKNNPATYATPADFEKLEVNNTAKYAVTVGVKPNRHPDLTGVAPVTAHSYYENTGEIKRTQSGTDEPWYPPFKIRPQVDSTYTPGGNTLDSNTSINPNSTDSPYLRVRQYAVDHNNRKQGGNTGSPGEGIHDLNTTTNHFYKPGTYTPGGIITPRDKYARVVYEMQMSQNDNNQQRRTIPARGSQKVITTTFSAKFQDRNGQKNGTLVSLPRLENAADTSGRITVFRYDTASLTTHEARYATTRLPVVNLKSAVVKNDAANTLDEKLSREDALVAPGTDAYNNKYENQHESTYEASSNPTTKVAERYRVDLEYQHAELVTEFRGKFTVNNVDSFRAGDIKLEIKNPTAPAGQQTLPADLFTCKILSGNLPNNQTQWEQATIHDANTTLQAGTYYYRCLHRNIANATNGWTHSGHLNAKNNLATYDETYKQLFSTDVNKYDVRVKLPVTIIGNSREITEQNNTTIKPVTYYNNTGEIKNNDNTPWGIRGTMTLRPDVTSTYNLATDPNREVTAHNGNAATATYRNTKLYEVGNIEDGATPVIRRDHGGGNVGGNNSSWYIDNFRTTDRGVSDNRNVTDPHRYKMVYLYEMDRKPRSLPELGATGRIDTTFKVDLIHNGRKYTPLVIPGGETTSTSTINVIREHYKQITTNEVAHLRVALPGANVTTETVLSPAGIGNARVINANTAALRPGQPGYTQRYGTDERVLPRETPEKVKERYRVDIEYGIRADVATEFVGKITVANAKNLKAEDLNFNIEHYANGYTNETGKTDESSKFRCRLYAGNKPNNLEEVQYGTVLEPNIARTPVSAAGDYYFKCVHQRILDHGGTPNANWNNRNGINAAKNDPNTYTEGFSGLNYGPNSKFKVQVSYKPTDRNAQTMPLAGTAENNYNNYSHPYYGNQTGELKDRDQTKPWLILSRFTLRGESEYLKKNTADEAGTADDTQKVRVTNANQNSYKVVSTAVYDRQGNRIAQNWNADINAGNLGFMLYERQIGLDPQSNTGKRGHVTLEVVMNQNANPPAARNHAEAGKYAEIRTRFYGEFNCEDRCDNQQINNHNTIARYAPMLAPRMTSTNVPEAVANWERNYDFTSGSLNNDITTMGSLNLPADVANAYRDATTGIIRLHTEDSGQNLLIRKYGKDETPIAGAEFVLRKTGATQTSDFRYTEATKLYESTEKLTRQTTYEVIETKAPAGYLLLPIPVEIQVDNNGRIALSRGMAGLRSFTITRENPDATTEEAKGKYILEIRNIEDEMNLPNVGGIGVYWLSTIGGLLILIGVVRRRKAQIN